MRLPSSRTCRALFAIAAGILAMRPPLAAQNPAGSAHVGEARLSPDGTTIAFVLIESRDGLEQANLWRVPFIGGTPQRLTTAAERARHVRWAPDGRQLSYLTRPPGPNAAERLTLISDGHPARVLGPAGVDACEWRPDGREIACLTSDAPSRLRVIDTTSGRERRVPASRTAVAALAWSPAGSTLAVITSATNGEGSVAIVGGSRPRVLAASGPEARQLSWSPGANAVSWISGAEDSPVLREVGTSGGPARIVSGLGGRVMFAGWNARERLAVASRSGAATIIEQFDTRARTTIEVLGPGVIAIAGPPSWSRDGRRYAVPAANHDHGVEVFAGSLPPPPPAGSDTVGGGAPPPTVRRITFLSRP